MSTVSAVTKSLVLKRVANKNGKGTESCLRWDPHEGLPCAPGVFIEFPLMDGKRKTVFGFNSCEMIGFSIGMPLGEISGTERPGAVKLESHDTAFSTKRKLFDRIKRGRNIVGLKSYSYSMNMLYVFRYQPNVVSWRLRTTSTIRYRIIILFHW